MTLKSSEIRDKTDGELVELEKQLRDQLVKLNVARATQRARNTAQFGRLRRDIARVVTIRNERKLGIGVLEQSAGDEGGSE